MEKISQGKYEIFTAKADAIDKFMQLQGVCSEEISDERRIEFYCSEKGKIIITNPPTKRVDSDHSTNLYAEVVEQEGKTYVTFYTGFIKANHVLKLVSLTITIIMAVIAIVLAIVNVDKTVSIVALFFCLVYFVSRLFTSAKERSNSPKDSETLVKELEKRVNAVNKWNK